MHQTPAPHGAPAAPASTVEDYQKLVEKYRASLSDGHYSLDWVTIPDVRKAPQVVHVKEHRWRRATVPYTVHDRLEVTETMRSGYRLLRHCQDMLGGLSLPPDSPIPAQVDAALHRLCDLADPLRGRYPRAFYATRAVEHDEAVDLVAQVAAIVKLAELREAVVHSGDPESLRRTAAALVADLAAARECLGRDPIDRALTSSSR